MAEQQQSTELADVYGAHASDGLQNVTGADLTTPFLMILQSNSPQVKKGTPSHIPGLEEGMIINSVTGEFYEAEDGFWFVQTGFVKKLVEWAPKRGGLKGSYSVDHPVRNTAVPKENSDGKIELVLPNGNIIVETAYHYGFEVPSRVETSGTKKDPIETRVFDFDNAQQAVVSMSSSALKPSRLLISQLSGIKMGPPGAMFTPPTYSRIINFTSGVIVKGDNSWFNWGVDISTKVEDVNFVMNSAIPMSEDVVKGKIEVGSPTGEYAQLDGPQTAAIADGTVNIDNDDGAPKEMGADDKL